MALISRGFKGHHRRGFAAKGDLAVVQATHAIHGVEGDHEDLLEPIVDRPSIWAAADPVEIRLDLSSGR